MTILKITAAAAALAIAATPAFAGGFSYRSMGGNHGKWAYADGEASGSVTAFGSGKIRNESGSYALAEKTWNSASSEAGGFNNLSLRGHGVMKSTTSAFSGAGVGFGGGFKSGGVR
jgi:hypothetical protein